MAHLVFYFPRSFFLKYTKSFWDPFRIKFSLGYDDESFQYNIGEPRKKKKNGRRV
jgi:hypothetical protein